MESMRQQNLNKSLLHNGKFQLLPAETTSHDLFFYSRIYKRAYRTL